jgi:transposase-like protein
VTPTEIVLAACRAASGANQPGFGSTPTEQAETIATLARQHGCEEQMKDAVRKTIRQNLSTPS